MRASRLRMSNPDEVSAGLVTGAVVTGAVVTGAVVTGLVVTGFVTVSLSKLPFGASV